MNLHRAGKLSLQNRANCCRERRFVLREGKRFDKVCNTGRISLFGEVNISGAKNAAVAIIPAALMVDGVCRIENVPQISDVTLCLKILEQLGANIRAINRHTVEIDCTHIRSTRTSYELARKIRASYYLIGALLGRFGQAEVAMPGGCNFGVRPIDQHVKGFTTMGAKVVVEAASSTPPRRMAVSRAPIFTGCGVRGCHHEHHDGRCHGGGGSTVIENAAKEPHIVDLANFLNSMGANIRGAGTGTIKIGAWTVCGAAATPSFPIRSKQGPIWPPWLPPAADPVKNIIPKHMDCITAKLVEMGGWKWRSTRTRCWCVATPPAERPM